MDIVVCVKTNPDLQMIRIKNREPVLEAIPFKAGDLEKNAVEAALQLRLAMGADEAVLVIDPALEAADQAGVATALAAALRKIGSYDLVLFGEGSTDNYTGQVGSRVAEILGLPQIGYARKITAGGAGVLAERSMDDSIETLEAPLPAAVTVVSEINEPRIPSLMNIMKAGKKPVEEWSLADLGLDATAVTPVRTILSNLAEEQDRKHIMFEGGAAEQAAAFVNALIKEGVLGR